MTSTSAASTLLDFGPAPIIDPSSPLAEKKRAIRQAVADVIESAIVTTQFTVLVDTREQAPYGFTGLRMDDGRPLVVVVQSECLGIGWGDYSIRGMHPKLAGRPIPDTLGEPWPVVSIERKSPEDAASTILGWGQHRDNFERELSQLNGLTFAAIMVECPEHVLYENAPEYGKKTKAENAKTLARSIDSWRQQFNRVQWVFAPDRRWAEIKTFRLLEKFWRENHTK